MINFTTDMIDVGGTDHGQGAPGFVFRYNTFELSKSSGGWFFTIHGLQSMTISNGYNCPSGCGYDSCSPSIAGSCNETVDSCQQWSTIKSEYYGNRVVNASYLHSLVGHRGSWLMMFYNDITGIGSAPTLGYAQFACDSCQSPSTPAYSQHVQNSYIFKNMYNGANVKMTKGLDYCADASVGTPYVITENVDYWNEKDNFDGITGVGIGTLANRPSTCTSGVGYWATSQSTTDLSGITGTHPATPISGTFYKCTSQDTWTPYYTPYIYPHPLTVAPSGANICGEGAIASQCWCEGLKANGYCCSGYYKTSQCGTAETCSQYRRLNATTLQACSCSQGDVQAAVNDVGIGDTVLVPDGNCSWSNTVACGYENTADTALCIKKSINLQGSGADKTIIRRSGTIIIWAPEPSGILKHESLKINRFTFDGNGNSVPGMIRLSSPSNEIVYAAIGNNKFKNSFASAIRVYGPVDGAVYSNEFVDVAIINGVFGRDGESWASLTREYGTGNNLYFEDNDISYTKNMDPGWTESGQGGRVAFRYNSYDSTNTNSGEYWDVHGLQSCPGAGSSAASCEQYSTMVAEYYGNMIVMTSAYRWILHRGSWLMMFNNYVTGGTTYPGITIGQYSCDQCAYGQEGYAQHVSNTYVWNNMIRGRRMDMAVQADYCNDGSCGNFPNYTITMNRDFFNYDASCTASSCLRGIGCGAAAPTGTCSPGVGYWVTSAAPCNVSPSTMDDMRTYTQSGRFYKCIEPNTWTEYYKPYIYPHPLTVAPFATEVCDEGQINSSCWCEGLKANGYCCSGYYQTTSCVISQPVIGDINGDRLVDINDLVLMALHFGQSNAHPQWNATTDVVANNEIDIFDVVFVASRFT
jgi:hypothetical protein